ncbi:MAG TPA: gephyrin-like molybdotransferase Glp [Ilumatobacteraceae bacterium]|nr:gephyrin-like molybdotransferase Glp [Ilumatobacteraceae bacterium]
MLSGPAAIPPPSRRRPAAIPPCGAGPHRLVSADVVYAGTEGRAVGYLACVTPLEDAQAFVLESCPPLAAVDVDRLDASGLVLATAVIASEVVPPFDNSAVDGYAVRSEDVSNVPVELHVTDELAAGAAPTKAIGAGEAIRIMTGAPMPDGADAVVMVEDSERVGDHAVRLTRSVPAGAAIRRAGDDVQIGDELFSVGTTITPAVAAVLASVNATRVEVHRRARVAVLSTGDELVDDGSPLELGQIRESNKTMLAAMLADVGCDVVDLGVVRDDEAELERVLRSAAADCDAIVSSGGVSMGDYDVVKAVLGRIADMTWMQIAIKPAKPFAFGRLDGTPIFGLPGNPVSSLVSFELLTRPALRRMMGHRRLTRTSMVAVADVPLARSRDGKVHFMRVNGEFGDDGRYHVRPLSAQGSHQLAATALADAMAVVPDGDGIPDGADVAVLLLHGN